MVITKESVLNLKEKKTLHHWFFYFQLPKKSIVTNPLNIFFDEFGM